jgi:hypothetical protein
MNLADWRCSYCSKKPFSFLPINFTWSSIQRELIENHCLTCTSSCLRRQIAFQKKCRKKQLEELDCNQELQLEEQEYSRWIAEEKHGGKQRGGRERKRQLAGKENQGQQQEEQECMCADNIPLEFKWIEEEHIYVKVGKTEHPAQVISKPYLFENNWVVDIIWITTPERKTQRVSCSDCTGKLYDKNVRPRREKRQPERYADIVPKLVRKVEGKDG